MLFLLYLLTICLSAADETGCTNRISENHCVECDPSHHLELQPNDATGIPSLVCVANQDVANCAEMENGACIRCNIKYYLHNNECIGCVAGCNYCNDQVCYQCGTDETNGTQLYLSTDETRCIDCTQQANDEECGRCDAGKYFNIETKNCQPCKDDCALCTESYNCYQCKNNKLLNKKDNPTASDPDTCDDIVNCDPTTGLKSDHCELCLPGFRLEKGNCAPCDEGCDVCYLDDTGNNFCSICSEDKTMDDGKCKDNSELNCKEGSKTYGCLECVEGYYFDSSYKCKQCSSTCGTCVSEPTHCLSCAPTYFFKTNTSECIKMDDNCNLADQAGCKECKNNLTSTENDTALGYYVPPGEQNCKQCEGNCKLCEGEPTHCSACITDFVLENTTIYDENKTAIGSYYACVPKGKDCFKTEMGYCTECRPGFFIQGGDSQECISCNITCGTCKTSDACLSCDGDYFMSKADQADGKDHLCTSRWEINMTCTAGPNGCETCNDGYYINREDPTQTNCTECPVECELCEFKSTDENDPTVGYPVCTLCLDNRTYVKDGKCAPCTELKNCEICKGTKCDVCAEGYNLDAGETSCSKTNWALIIPLIIVGVIIIIIIFVIIIGIIWWRRVKSVKAETAAIKPFHVGSDLELLLLGADNEKFPLKTDKWELTFGLSKTKAIVDTEYTETVNLANMSKSQYYFEFHFTPSHKYDLNIEPMSATLKAGTAIPVTFKIKMLCTTSVSDNIGISAMDIDDNNKETAKFTIVIESDLSLKLDHTELKPIMPPIGEGAFGMVFRGTYRVRDVAIKKMKARNLTQEQEKEFNHEVSMMTQLRQNCVVELIGAVYTEGEIAIVTEYAEYGSLSKMWGKNPVSYQLKVKMLDDMAVGLAYLHQNEVLHRDVKGENLLVFSLNPHSPVCAKLTDFGTCRNISERSLQSKALSQGIGTPTYMAPECLQNTSDYSYPVDVYAFGIVLYETYIEKNAFENDERFNQPWMIPQFVIEGKRLDKPAGVPENYWDLTTKCWKQNPEERPTFSDVLKIIESWGEDIRYALSTEAEKKDMPPPAQNAPVDPQQEVQQPAAVENEDEKSKSSDSE
ncbi:hypothetical protein EIN_281120 [Entamoeba invadens IP1]|uniref:Protein kinase domain-containing protein n=1 Tax=Entamoeba invadens IP1 TaxID=370355 RepID=A0A0A1TZW2_ENTIV|nr:hypothetical protein EIN_281120 [Entamoeba invadens IP1]ELP85751.1 hypothetical protein EIN_281120 [Entamoeba invadens IP1]|eukprot:XP_004185097.1 hypothetical protein EIN_281120 [Entamoeba invadens IP1]